MVIANSLIVVVQNEPRDGDIVYIEKSFEDFKQRVVDSEMVSESGSEVIELEQTYYDDSMMSTIRGYAVQLPYTIENVCPDCFQRGDSGYQNHSIGDSMVVNFTDEEHCENCN